MDILKLQSIDSTNDFLYNLAKTKRLESGFTVTAEHQTAGKGTKGRKFSSPKNTGIYMSILLKNIPNENLLFVTPLAGVVVRRAILDICKIETKIKPINDLYLDGKKICGILTRANSSNGKCNFIIVGIGINLYKPENDFDADIRNIAGALFEKETDNTLKEKLIEEIAARLKEKAETLDETIMNEYNRNLIEL